VNRTGDQTGVERTTHQANQEGGEFLHVNPTLSVKIARRIASRQVAQGSMLSKKV
jgi:hypothetical protein